MGLEKLSKSVKMAAQQMSKMHASFTQKKGTLMSQAKKYFDYDYYMSKLKEATVDLKIDLDQYNKVEKKYNASYDLFSRADVPAEAAHSDANAANFIFDGNEVAVIDVETLGMSLDRNQKVTRHVLQIWGALWKLFAPQLLIRKMMMNLTI